MESLNDEGSRTIADYTGWIRRRWWVIVAVVLLALAVTAAVTVRQHRVYTATTSVLVQATGTTADQPQSGARTISGLNMDTEAQLVRSLVVADRARHAITTGLSAADLAARVAVSVPPNTQVLDIAYSAGQPATARAGSQAFATAYLDQRAAKVHDDIAAQVTALESQQRTLLGQLQQLSDTIAGLPPSSADARRGQAQLNVAESNLGQISARLSTLRAGEPNPGSVITAAALPTRPSSPDPVLAGGTGLGGGLLLGLLLALLLDRRDTRVHRADEVADRTGIPVLLDLRRGGPPALATPQSPAARDFSRLRGSLASALDAAGLPANRARIVVTCGAAPGQAAGLVTANLAAALDRFGIPVLIVCADPGSWTLRAFDVPPGRGLAEVLRGEVAIADAAVAVSPGVRLLGPGDPDGDGDGLPSREMREDRVRDLVARLHMGSGYALFEAPPPEVSVDAQVLAPHADAVLVVVETKRARLPALEEAVRSLAEVRARLVAAVVVGQLGRSRRRSRTRRARPAERAVPAGVAVRVLDGGVVPPQGVVPPTPQAPVSAPNPSAAGPAGAVGTSAVVDAAGNPVPPLQDDDTQDLGEPATDPPEVVLPEAEAPPDGTTAGRTPDDRIRSR